jgi:hypothetical protein
MNSNYKDHATLTFMDDRDQLTLLGRQVMRRVLNEAVEELVGMHNANLNAGKIESLLTTRADVEALLLRTTQKQLGSGADVVQG